MKDTLRYALLGGATFVVLGGIAAWAITESSAPSSPVAEVRDSSDAGQTQANNQGRSGGKFFHDFDLNHDGQVTRAELEQASNQRFIDASGGKDSLTAEQFAEQAAKDFRDRTERTFHDIDWNSDGKVSLEEYFVPGRAAFQALDRDAAGSVACTRAQTVSDTSDGNNRAARSKSRGGPRGAQSLAVFCRENDLNKDGTVTHAELDQATKQRFASAAGTAKELSPQAYTALEEARFKDINARLFQRMDTNGDGKVTKEEYTARDIKLFARLDKNADGIVTKAEAASGRRTKTPRPS
ncbi:MAG: EF-hand domain-containing protein [Proteobacteria bacterium]|nr:EF-hand domain-containing protein [Pseudomonadota bacterium]